MEYHWLVFTRHDGKCGRSTVCDVAFDYRAQIYFVLDRPVKSDSGSRSIFKELGKIPTDLVRQMLVGRGIKSGPPSKQGAADSMAPF